MSIWKSLTCLLPLIFISCLIGCKTTAPSLGYIPPSKEIIEAYVNKKRSASIDDNIPFDGVYLDFGKDGGHTTQRVVWVTGKNGKVLNNQPLVNHGEDLTGRVFSNVGVPVGLGTVIASPLWGYLGQRARRPDRSYYQSGNVNANASADADADATGGN